MSDAETQALAVGVRLIAEKYPDFDKREKTPEVKDAGTEWKVTYRLPPDMLGGAPVVLLDKQTLALVRSYRTQ